MIAWWGAGGRIYRNSDKDNMDGIFLYKYFLESNLVISMCNIQIATLEEKKNLKWVIWREKSSLK